MKTSSLNPHDDWLEGDVDEPPKAFDEAEDDVHNLSWQSSKKNGSLTFMNLFDPIVHGIAYCAAFIQYYFVYHRFETLLGTALVLMFILGLSGIITSYERRQFHEQLEAAGISTDFTEIKSKFDLKIGSVENWCLLGGFKGCDSCINPLEPVPGDRPHWRIAHEKNVHMIQHFFEAHGTTMGNRQSRRLMTELTKYSAEDDFFLFMDDADDNTMNDDTIHEQINTEHNFTGNSDKNKVNPLTLVDVVFLGGNTTEAYVSRVIGRKNRNQDNIKDYFETKFDKSKGGDYNALALGIHGDTSPNILWRILNGELPSNLKPKIFWLNMGLNDLASTSCSAEITLMGILRVVEELQNLRPEAKIVINSILPYSTEPLGYLEGWRKKKSDKIDYWAAIKAVNGQLQSFANKHKNVEFFDATDMFTQWSGKTLIMKANLIARRGPQRDGYKLLIDQQLERIHTWIIPAEDEKTTKEESSKGEEAADDDYMDDFFSYYGEDDDYFTT